MEYFKKIILYLFLLIIGFSVGYSLKSTTVTSQKSKIKDINTRSGTIIEAQTGSFNKNGKIDTVQLQLLFKYNGLSNARLVVLEDGKEISSKDVTLENNLGKLELVHLFNDSNQQILFTAGAGAHSMNGFFYQLKDSTLIPICPDDNKEDKQRGLDCFFFSDAPSIYAKDLDGDGVSEIIASGHSYYDWKSSDQIYKWDGLMYKLVKK